MPLTSPEVIMRLFAVVMILFGVIRGIADLYDTLYNCREAGLPDSKVTPHILRTLLFSLLTIVFPIIYLMDN